MSNRVAVSEVFLAKLLRRWHMRCEDTNGGGVESQKGEQIAMSTAQRQQAPAGGKCRSGASFHRPLALG